MKPIRCPECGHPDKRRQAAREAVSLLRALRATWAEGFLGRDWDGAKILKEFDEVTAAIAKGLGVKAE